ncbi:MAG TPA: hypothetical protein VIM70_19865 [Clostridium sp.]|uniref:hypothetical protein n=1 Tax=Clostridium sp. TaxID=1506 RepID=UPI002F945D67
MPNEVIKKCVGQCCRILSTGSSGIVVVAGKIIDVIDNWIEVETKKCNVLVNAEFVQSIEINQK